MKLDKDLYTIKEVAAMFEVTKPTVYDWMNRRGLEWVIVGGRRRIPAAAIEAFVKLGSDQQEKKEYNPGSIRTPMIAGALVS